MNNNTEYFLSINEVSKKLDVPAHTLRYWEKQFGTVIKPTTGANGRRYYRPETVDAIAKIREYLYSNGMTIAGVKKLLKDGGLVASVGADIIRPNDKGAKTATAPLQPSVQSADINHAVALLEQARGLLAA